MLARLSKAGALFLLTAVFLSWLALPATAVPAPAKINAFAEEDPNLAKMTFDLLQARKKIIDTTPSNNMDVIEEFLPHAIRGDRFHCLIGVTEETAAFQQEIDNATLEVVGTHALPSATVVVVAATDPRVFDPIVALDEVIGITPEPAAVVMAGDVTSQADRIILTRDVRTEYGVDGSGLRVGVLSDSINDTAAVGGTVTVGNLTGSNPQTSGDLPAFIPVLDPGPGGGTDEGAAMMELIYDLAPGVELAFASGLSGYTQFAENIRNLYTNVISPVDILVDDVLYFAEPLYQDGPIAMAAEEAVAAGVTYFTAAGNFADLAFVGLYDDVNPIKDGLVFPSQWE